MDKIINTTAAGIANLIPAFTGLTGDAVIAAGGAIVAPIFQNAITELSQRVLSSLQLKKVVTTTNNICVEIARKIENGKSIRDDDFFTPHYNPVLDTDESSASKLLEGTLLKSKEEYDSKKIPFLSFLTANIYFAPNISESKAFVLLEILSKLSYRQLCALVLFYRKNVLPIGKCETGLKGVPFLQNYYDVFYEFLSLKDYLLIEQNMPNGGTGMGISDYRISALGRDLVITADCCSIPQEDLTALECEIDFIISSLP